MRYQGKITKWNDDKGFGFITRNDSNQQIFVHISAFDKSQQRQRPTAGEIVSFEIADDIKKGLQAYNVIYLNRQSSTVNRKTSTKTIAASGTRIRLGFVAKILGVLLMGFVLYRNADVLNAGITRLASESALEEVSTTVEIDEKKERYVSKQVFTCSGKTHCSQMSSCEEAKYYLNNCPGTITDGDGDGIPCEDQWCGH